jgi:hypothetical protein
MPLNETSLAGSDNVVIANHNIPIAIYSIRSVWVIDMPDRLFSREQCHSVK